MGDIRLIITLGREEVGEEGGDDDEDEADDYACAGEGALAEVAEAEEGGKELPYPLAMVRGSGRVLGEQEGCLVKAIRYFEG